MTENGQEQYAQPQYAEPNYAGAAQPQCNPPTTYMSEEQAYQQTYQQQQYTPPQNPYAQYGAPQNMGFVPQQSVPTDKSKIAAGVLGILLGAFGAHKFYLGYTKEAVIMLLVSLLTFGIGLFVMSVIGLVEGIVYLTKTDVDFYNTYVVGRKGWF